MPIARAPRALINAPVLQAPPPEAESARPVDTSTTFDPEASYRVKLNGIANYLGTPLSPMHVHTVTGVVAEAIRADIAAFERA